MNPSNGVGESYTRSKVVRIRRHSTRVWPQWIRNQTFCAEGLYVVTDAQAYSKTAPEPDRILREPRIFNGIRTRFRYAEILDVVARHLVCIGPQGSDLHAIAHRCEGPGIYPHIVEDVLAAEQRWKEIVSAGEQCVSSEFPGVTRRFEAQSIREVIAVFACSARQDRGAPKSV